MFTRIVLAILTFVLLPLAAAPSVLVREMPAAAVLWRQRVTEEQFRALLMQKVGELDFMRDLWAFEEKNPDTKNKVYLGGGILRGVVQWLEIKLQRYPLETVRRLSPPMLHELTLPGADYDIFLTGDARKDRLPAEYQTWDVLDDGFLAASRMAGGSDIEKFGANPFSITDEFEALSAYYRGTLNFTDAGPVAMKESGLRLSDNSKTALALRHLRFLLFFNATRVTEDDVATLRRMLDADVTRIFPENYWVKKALKKLQLQAEKSRVNPLSVMVEAGLLPLLGRRYALEDQENLYRHFLKTLEAGGDWREELRDLKKYGGTVEACTYLMVLALPHARDAKDFLEIISPGVESPSAAYLKAIRELWPSRTRMFVALRPTADDVREAKLRLTFVEPIWDFLLQVTSGARDAAEFTGMMRPEISEPSPAYKNVLNEVWSKRLPKFIDLHPGPNEWAEFKRSVTDADTLVRAMNLGAIQAKSPAEFLSIMTPEIPNPSDYYLEQLQKIWQSRAMTYLNLRPTPDDLNALKTSPRMPLGALMSILDAAAKRARSADEFRQIYEPGVPNPNSEYLTLLNQGLSRAKSVDFEANRRADEIASLPAPPKPASKISRVLGIFKGGGGSSGSCSNLFTY